MALTDIDFGQEIRQGLAPSLTSGSPPWVRPPKPNPGDRGRGVPGGDPRRVVSETVSGCSAVAQRPGFIKLLNKMEQDDVRIVTKQCRRTHAVQTMLNSRYHQESSGSWQDWYDGMIAEVKLAETLGFDSAWFAEHRVPGFAFGSPALFIAALARETSRIRLGSSVSLLPLNNPVRIAEDYAMADVLSHGRLDSASAAGFTNKAVDVESSGFLIAR